MLAEGIEITITVKFVFVKKSRIKWMIPLAWGKDVISLKGPACNVDT